MTEIVLTFNLREPNSQNFPMIRKVVNSVGKHNNAAKITFIFNLRSNFQNFPAIRKVL